MKLAIARLRSDSATKSKSSSKAEERLPCFLKVRFP